MEFLLLIADAPDGEAGGDLDAGRWVDDLESRGAHLYGNRTRPGAEATVVKVRGGEVVTATGVLHEGHDWIAGFDVIECDSLDDAIQIAAAHPMARAGQIEIRPVWPFDDE
ncbi:YciI family protein [Conyzicola sp.]|uniref:YciI family protein n=1 Tax=Conyzicola sp. TaxID=1969404 RepID=UPI003988F246